MSWLGSVRPRIASPRGGLMDGTEKSLRAKEARRKAWETRRAAYGPKGYSPSAYGGGATGRTERLRTGALPLDPNGPACDCCPHTSQAEVQQNRYLRDVWDRCPASDCLDAVCPLCETAKGAALT